MISHNSQPQSGMRNGLQIATAVIGGVALVFSLGTPVLGSGPAFDFFGANTVFNDELDDIFDDSGDDSATPSQGDDSIDLSNITDIDIDVDHPGEFNVLFDSSLDEAEFNVSDTKGSGKNIVWNVETENESLEITAKGSGNYLGNRVRDLFDPDSREFSANLVLPEKFNDGSLNLDISGSAMLSAVEGDYQSLDVNMGAGKLTFTGSAHTLTSEIGAGELIASVTDLDRLDIEVSTGHAQLNISGTTPSRVVLNVAAGAAEVTLPHDSYRVSTDLGLGEIENNLSSDTSSSHKVHAEVGVGRVSLNEG